jgi:hypothetical protein
MGSFLGAISRFPLYLFGYGLRSASPATKKDVVPIGASVKHLLSTFEKNIRKVVILKESRRESFQLFSNILVEMLSA